MDHFYRSKLNLIKIASTLFNKVLQKLLLILMLFSTQLIFNNAFSQKTKVKRSDIKFGDVKLSDFEPRIYSIDSTASAIVLSDIGESYFEGNTKGDFNLIFKHHRRLRVLKKNGYAEATVQIPLYSDFDMEEKIENLEAITYNLKDGQVNTVKLNKESIFFERKHKNKIEVKFTFPRVEEGTIIEWKYKIVSPFYFNLRSWSFQTHLPVLFSEYIVTIPTLFDFAISKQGSLKYDMDDASVSSQNFYISDYRPKQTGFAAITMIAGETNTYTVTSPIITQVWNIKNVPAVKIEDFISSPLNKLQRIEFQLKAIRFEHSSKDIYKNWEQTAKEFLEYSGFGGGLEATNDFIRKELKQLIPSNLSRIEGAKTIYQYVRDNFSCKGNDSLYLTQSLRSVLQSKAGSVSDINLLLVAALKVYNYEACPVVLSTKDNGRVAEDYPMLNKFDYVIARLKIDDKYYLLDAADKMNGFGKLGLQLYNGFAKTLEPIPQSILLEPDSIREAKVTSLYIVLDGTKSALQGSYQCNYGYYKSSTLRQNFLNKSLADFKEEISKNHFDKAIISNLIIDSLHSKDDPISVKYDFRIDINEDIFYLNPLFTEQLVKNPFNAGERSNAVELPYTIDEVFIFDMEIPEGYKVDDVPKLSRVKFNESEGLFEYIVAVTDTHVQLRVRLALFKATFDAEDYSSLRDFYATIIKKENEQIVLKKIK